MEDRKLKSKILKAWENSFPQLFPFAPNKLYKTIGPIIIGIELIQIPKTIIYRPYFVIYSLWKKNLKECLEYPIVNIVIENKGIPIELTYTVIDERLNNTIEIVSEQIDVLLENNVKLYTILNIVDKYLVTPIIGISTGSYLQARLYEFKYDLAVFLNNDDLINSVWGELIIISWDAQHFALWGSSIDKWVNSLKEKLNNRKYLIDKVLENKEDSKINKLKNSIIVL